MKAEKDSPRESPEDTGARASGGATEEKLGCSQRPGNGSLPRQMRPDQWPDSQLPQTVTLPTPERTPLSCARAISPPSLMGEGEELENVPLPCHPQSTPWLTAGVRELTQGTGVPESRHWNVPHSSVVNTLFLKNIIMLLLLHIPKSRIPCII